MTNEPNNNDDLERLLDSWNNGTLGPEQYASLNQMLRSREARERYLDWMEIEGALEEVFAPSAADTELKASLNTVESHFDDRKPRPWGTSGWKLFAIAASVTCLVASVWFLGRASITSTTNGFSVLGPRVARVTATRNCRWVGRADGVGFGAPLHEGERLELIEGLAEISFDRGGSIIIEGPAKLDLQNASEVFLREGHLAAAIPVEARGLMIRTDRFGVRDLGAEFGLLADADGGEVHVFKGNIQADLFNDSGATIDTLGFGSAEAAQFVQVSNKLQRIDVDSDRFVRSLSPSAGPHDGLHLHESFDYPAGPLVWQNGGFGWAGPWEDLETIEVDLPGVPLTNRVGANSLEAENMVCTGGRAVQNGHRNRIRRVISTSIGGIFESAGLVENRDGELLVGRDGTHVYISFLQRASRTDDGFYGVELNRGDGNRNRVLCIGNGSAGAGYGVTSEYNEVFGDNYPSLGKEDTETNFFVVRIDFGVKDADRATIYRNPTSLVDEETCKPTATLEGFLSFDRIGIGNFAGEKVHEIDEIRIGTSFRAVTGRRDAPSQHLSRTRLAHFISLLDHSNSLKRVHLTNSSASKTTDSSRRLKTETKQGQNDSSPCLRKSELRECARRTHLTDHLHTCLLSREGSC